MKLLHVTVSDDLAKELDKFPNKSHVVREALTMYNEHISTDTIDKLRISFSKMANHMAVLDDKLDKLLSKLDETMFR